ncbi:MAG: isochorismatase family protein [Gammaproteobacteria bacterium]|nr:MAG: isochorismatase family protein [Gammaproteobacteria bacterium]
MKPALLLVDIQNDYFPGGNMELVGIDIASSNARLLLDKFRDQDLQTFHIQHTFQDNQAGFLLPNTEGSEIHGSVDPLPSETVISKHFPNSFRETNLLDQLKVKNITDLVICGAMSHMCIEATARAAADLEFKCVVVQDACATRDIEFHGKEVSAIDVHNASMSALDFAYANVVNVDELI